MSITINLPNTHKLISVFLQAVSKMAFVAKEDKANSDFTNFHNSNSEVNKIIQGLSYADMLARKESIVDVVVSPREIELMQHTILAYAITAVRINQLVRSIPYKGASMVDVHVIGESVISLEAQLELQEVLEKFVLPKVNCGENENLELGFRNLSALLGLRVKLPDIRSDAEKFVVIGDNNITTELEVMCEHIVDFLAYADCRHLYYTPIKSAEMMAESFKTKQGQTIERDTVAYYLDCLIRVHSQVFEKLFPESHDTSLDNRTRKELKAIAEAALMFNDADTDKLVESAYASELTIGEKQIPLGWIFRVYQIILKHNRK